MLDKTMSGLVVTCLQKRAFSWRYQAEEVAARHLDCPKCGPRRRMEPYRCPYDPSHYHIGHGRH